MGLFKRKKDEEAKIQLEREALDKLNSNDDELFSIPAASEDDPQQNSEWRISGKIKAPHSITADELNGKSSKANDESTSEKIAEEIPMSDSTEQENSPSDFLYQKMMQSRAKLQEDTIQSEEPEKTADPTTEKLQQIPEEDIHVPLDIEAAINDIKNSANLKNDEPEQAKAEKTEKTSAHDTQEEVFTKTKVEDDTKSTEKKSTEAEIDDSDNSEIKGTAEERRATLLARCNAFLKDATDTVTIDTEKYRLESVESILKGVEARAAEKVNKKFNTATSVSITPTTDNQTTPSSVTGDTVIFQAPITSSTPKAPENTENQPTSPTTVKHIFVAEQPKKDPKDNSNNSDISSTRIITDISSHSKPQNTNAPERTTVFPIIDTPSTPDDYNNTEKNNIQEDKETKQTFEDYTSVADAPRILKSLSKKKKNFALRTLLSFLVLIASSFLLMPISQNILPSQTTQNILDLVFCILILLINVNTLNGLKSLFTTKAKNSLPAVLSVLAATLFAVINLAFKGNFIGFSAVTALSLTSYNLANKSFYSKTIKNFKLIANTEFKNAVSIIQNKTATQNVAGDFIEGSALVCYGGETTNIHNFIKYSFCQNPISDKIQKLSLISIIIGFALGIATLLLNASNIMLAIYIFCAAICFCSIPSVYHIISITVNSANKRLNHYGAMITGYHAADELELCNAVAISSNELFPEGTIRFVDMKLLSHNPIDQSILDALSVASAINSPIAGIFKQMDITKAYKDLVQQADTVIYEEKMGISGWVNDRRVFVGNRDLLIAHGFNGLPPAELDKKIMRKGYFPVYIASDNIPCALLIVRYEPDQDIVYEIQRLANTGTTILVDNCDPNISAQMLTDYFELYNETIFVMNKRASDSYKSLTVHKEHRKAGAAFKSRIEGLLASLTAAINIKRYVSRMTVFYICSIILGLLALITCILSSLNTFITPLNIILVQLLLTAITLLPTVLHKP